jgi:hypothetical protein
MSVENSLRIFLFCLGVWAAIFGPPWLPVIVMVLIVMRFRAWEVVFLGIFTDFLWAPGLHVPLYLIASIVIVWAFEPLRKELLIS